MCIFGASLNEPHIDRDNVNVGNVCIWHAGCVCLPYVPENTPIQSITRSARA